MFHRSEAHLVPPEVMKNLMAEQIRLAGQVKIQPLLSLPKIIAGVDSSLVDSETILSVFVVMNYPNLEILEISHAIGPIPLPYIPGFLGFREIPTLLKAYESLKIKPDLLFVDGNGIIHRRKIGIASQLGVLLDKPSLGIAKKLLVGKYVEPEILVGSHTDVIFKEQHLGDALRSRTGVKPVFVSPGHLIDHKGALNLVISTLGKYRLPEPTRIADQYSKSLKLGLKSNNPPLIL